MASGGLRPFAEGIWLDTAPVSFLGLHLTATMAVLRVADDRLLLYSPLGMTPNRRRGVEALGRVAHLYAPNLFHHRWIGEWASAFTSASVSAPPELAKKRKELRIDRVNASASGPDFAGSVDEVQIDGFLLQECVLFHRRSRTLIVADLLHNIGRSRHRWTRLYARAMGFYDCIAVSRMIRWTAFPNRVAARESIDKLLALPFDQIIVGHGEPVVADPRAALAAAYNWLPKPPK